MDEKGTIHEELALLLNEYDFSIDTISRYLGMEKDAVTVMSLRFFLKENESFPL